MPTIERSVYPGSIKSPFFLSFSPFLLYSVVNLDSQIRYGKSCIDLGFRQANTIDVILMDDCKMQNFKSI